MASRKEEKERLRQARLDAERKASSEARKRIILGYVVAGVLGAAVIGGVIFALASGGGGGDDPNNPSGQSSSSDNVNTTFGALPEGLQVDEREGTPPPEVEIGDLNAAADAAGCELRLDLPDEGNTHFTDPDKEPDYKTQPPTSGDHYFNPQESGSGALADGAFLDTPPLNRVVHSLEHGRVAIQYSPDLPEDQQLELKGLFDEAPAGVDLFPNPDMPYAVAAVAWTQLIGCETYEGAATIDALRAFRDEYLARGPEPVPIS
jgi:hypothetical protein